MSTPHISPDVPPLDELHRRARSAYVARDLNAYMELFSFDLRYQQADGRTIGRDQLAKDVKSQFRRVSAAESAYRTDRVEANSEGVVETLTQRAVIAATAFGYVHRLWHLERQGTYTWRQSINGWKIFEAKVSSESLTGIGFQIGRAPRLPALVVH